MVTLAVVIPVSKVRELTLDVSQRQSRSPHISAASSLERHKHHLFVIADDEMELGVFPLESPEHGHAIRILEGRLPRDDEDRKKEKPDLESLVLLPPFGRLEHGALLALGSGSSDKRNRGALIPLQKDGLPTEAHGLVDLEPLYDALRRELGELNIEGAAVVDDVLRLLQRGNNGTGRNARVDLSLEEVVKGLAAGDAMSPSVVREVVDCDLGQLHGVKLCFSDASALSDYRTVFAASAEGSGSSHSDGKTVGSAVGVMGRDGSISTVEPVDIDVKLEGLAARLRGDRIDLLMVTDADDPSVASPLLRAEL